MTRAMIRPTMKKIALAVALLCASGAQAAGDDAELLKLIRQLNARVERLEQRNAELENSLASDRISENEPELVTRLKAVENDALNMKKAAGKIDALDGLAVEAGLTTVAQHPRGLPRGTTDGNSQLNYRADVTLELPLDSIGDIEQKLFAHFRLGQGLGLNTPLANLSTFASAPNAVAFRASGAAPDDSVAILGQAWYQASIPLPFGGFAPRSREKLELTFGKMDMFGFFDQNALADDESSQFLNSVFVHNPLLDAGGDVGVDANGFQPGIVASYLNYRNGPEPWRLSLGIFGAGQGANYSRFFSSPLIVAQAETELKFDGLPGNYRLYYWRNGQASELSGGSAKHAGWGLSLDQRVHENVALFGRYGHQADGQVAFDRALTLGAEIGGSAWSRGGDAIGIAAGWLRASNDYRALGGAYDLDGDPTTLADAFTFTPSGAEQVTELYYRFRITQQFQLSPDVQFIRRAGANSDANNITVFGLRAQVSY